jgi:hypothetical protein
MLFLYFLTEKHLIYDILKVSRAAEDFEICAVFG